MEQRKAMAILSGRATGPGAALLRCGLSAAAVPYSLYMRIRRWAYRHRLLKSRAAAVPVICVGNLTTGGTGKTPTVAYVVRHLQERGLRPAVLTRGYKAVDGCSDEAELLRQATAAEVVVNADRVAGAAEAVARGCNVCVMDDGFQHRRLRRDLDIVLIDAERPWGFGRCLPRGLLREPVSALRDAGAVIVTRADRVEADRREAIEARLRRCAPQAVLAAACHAPSRLVGPAGQSLPLAELSGRKVVAFCGIARPRQFFHALAALGARVVQTVELDDHALYTPAVVEELRLAVRRHRAHLLVTTEKDLVKLRDAKMPAPLWALAIAIQLMAGEDALRRRMDATVGAAGAALS